jgi:hypothetical protein
MRTAVEAVATLAAVVLLGVPFGLLWAAVAPDVPVVVTDQGPVFTEAQPEELAAADGWFAILGVVVGLVAAVGAWLVARYARGEIGLVVVTVGAVGAALLAWWVGRQVGLSGYQANLAAADTGTYLDRPPDLRAYSIGLWPPRVLGVVLVPALVAAACYTFIAAWSRFPNLRPEPAPAVLTGASGPPPWSQP